MKIVEILKGRSHIWSLILAGLLLFGGNLAYAQSKQAKLGTLEQKAPISGARMFRAYCASCHGKDATGHGPAAAAMKTEPANLTTLAKRHDGKFPDVYVANVLRNGVKSPAHGDAEMPVWGPLFREMDPDAVFMHIRISSLVVYLKSLQVKHPVSTTQPPAFD